MPQHGLFPQGLRSFRDFADYRDNWIRTNLLPDLRTIFRGARADWESQGRPENGRGDFLLATALMSAFDHLGVFLAGPDDSLENYENIARVAQRLTSIGDIYAIVANLGRNALAHGVWPQTGMPVHDWAFGLNINAMPDDTEHNRLYVRTNYSLEPDEGTEGGQKAKILKLRLNVHFLRKELAAFINGEPGFPEVPAPVWARAQRISRRIGIPEHSTWLKKQRYRAPKLCLDGRIYEEIDQLHREAEDNGVWDGLRPYHRRATPVLPDWVD